MATNNNQSMVTMVMLGIISILLAFIYVRDFGKFSEHLTYRRDFSVESHDQNHIQVGHILPKTGSFSADRTSLRALETYRSGDTRKLLPISSLSNKPTLINSSKAVRSYEDNGDLKVNVIAKFNNLSSFNRSHFTKDLQINQTVTDQIKQVPAMCYPKKNIVLLKTHKTGSSTVQNILYRYGDNHDLVFALPKGRTNYFGGNTKFSRSFVRSLPDGHQVNMLANHARWNKKEFVAMMPNDAIYITILRHPVTQFESLYIYYNWQQFFHVPFYEFVKDPAKFCKAFGRLTSSPIVHSFKNPSLYDLGMDIGFKEPGKDVMKGKLQSLDEEFHLVLLMEYMEESVILLKDLMCWSWEDILYFSSNSRPRNQVNKVNSEISEKLIEWNAGDWLLYNHFNKTFWRKVENYGFERMKQDKIILRKKIEQMESKCLQGTKIVKEVQGTSIQRFQLSKTPHKLTQ